MVEDDMPMESKRGKSPSVEVILFCVVATLTLTAVMLCCWKRLRQLRKRRTSSKSTVADTTEALPVHMAPQAGSSCSAARSRPSKHASESTLSCSGRSLTDAVIDAVSRRDFSEVCERVRLVTLQGIPPNCNVPLLLAKIIERCVECFGSTEGVGTWVERVVTSLEKLAKRLQEHDPGKDKSIRLDVGRVWHSLQKLWKLLDGPCPAGSFTDPVAQRYFSDVTFMFDMCLGIIENEIPASELSLETKPIARGGFSHVYMCKYSRLKGQLVVAKVYSSDAAEKASFWNELSHLKRLKHECVVTMFGASRLNVGIRHSQSMALIMELVPDGTLREFLRNKGKQVTTTIAQQIIHDVASGMEYVHGKEIQHRDLKSANVLLSWWDNKLRAKVADFGISKLASSKTTTQEALQAFSLSWSAPEALPIGGGTGREDAMIRSKASDVYSFAIVLWEIATKKEPWSDLVPGATAGHRMLAVATQVKRGERPPLPENLLPGMRMLIEACWNGDMNERPTFEDIVKGLDNGAWNNSSLWPSFVVKAPTPLAYEAVYLEEGGLGYPSSFMTQARSPKNWEDSLRWSTEAIGMSHSSSS
ncbi:unnamed protein product [Chrysoparadoxa australica]